MQSVEQKLDKLEEEKMRCPYCGEMISDEALFCGYCGNKIEGTVSQKEEDIVEVNTNEEISDDTSETVQEKSSCMTDVLEACDLIRNYILRTEDKSGTKEDNILLQEENQQLKNENGEFRHQIQVLQEEIQALKEEIAKYKCPKCGAIINPEMKYCNVCGEKLFSGH